MPKARGISNHVFVTLTYKRDLDLLTYWKGVSHDFNRFIQRFRRLHTDGVEYLRTVEAHVDDYPHLHGLIQFKTGLVIENGKYFEDQLFQKWKTGLWQCGLSDFQVPSGEKTDAVRYIIKYITKTNTKKTIWRHLRNGAAHQAVPNSSKPTILNKSSASLASLIRMEQAKNISTKEGSTLFFCKQYKIKQCTWSRKFKFPVERPKSLLVAQSLLTSHN